MFDPTRHEKCTEAAWDPRAVRQVVNDCFENDESYLTNHRWTSGGNGANTTLYEGGLGVLWGLDYLTHALDREAKFSIADMALEIYGNFERFEATNLGDTGVQNFEASYFLGRAGALNALQKLNPVEYSSYQAELIEIARGNIANPTLEVLWGGPGSILPILNNLERSPNDETLSRLFIEQLEFLLSELKPVPELGCSIWTQDLYGSKPRLTGSGHGFAGNVYPFLRGQDFLSQTKRDELFEITVNTIIKTAVVSENLANWQLNLDSLQAGRPEFLVQWCHGAPGVIMALNNIPMGYATELDKLLIKAGETVWTAGPLTKGLGLCHGTDGNGYALLKLFERTGDEMWLDRARAFAMHAIMQYKRKTQPTPGFWTADSTLAHYLLACEQGIANVPLWDFV